MIFSPERPAALRKRTDWRLFRSFGLGLLLVIALLPLQGNAQTVQSSRVTITLQQQPLREVLKQLSQKSGIKIYFNDQLVDKHKAVNVKADNELLLTVLQKLLGPLSMEATVFDNNKITIEARATPAGPASKPAKGTGTVLDARTKQPLAGVSVYIKDQRDGVMTDAKGQFEFNLPPTGTVVTVSFVGYRTREIKVSGANSNLQVLMQEDPAELGEVQVMARRRSNTDRAVLAQRREAAIVQDAISAAAIERTASITTTQALQRVSGVTVTDDKYVAIRGLGDRSVIAQLNGVRLASSDPDRSSIPLDLIPASLLDNITVYKTYSPDKPADAAAGIVELKTMSVPDSASLSITAQTGFNTNIGIGGSMNSFYNNDPGFLGQKVKDRWLSNEFQELGKQYPNGFKDVQSMIAHSRNSPQMQTEVKRINGIMQQLDPVLTTRYQQAPLNQLYAATYGNSFTLFQKHKLGVIAGLSYYQRSTDIAGGDLTQWSIYQGVLTGNEKVSSPLVIPNYITPNNVNMGKFLNYKENTGTRVLNYGFLGGLTYRFNPRHEISMQYLGSRGADVQATNLHGAYQYSGLPGEVQSIVYSLKQSYRTLNTYNLQGEHKLLNKTYSPRLSYNIATSTSTQEDPDYRFVNMAVYTPPGGGVISLPAEIPGTFRPLYTPAYYALVSGFVNGYGPYGIIQADPNGRRFRKLKETNYNHKADLTIPFPVAGRKQELKVGGFYLHRERNFTENVMALPGSNFSDAGSIPLYEVQGNLDHLVGFDRIGVRPPSLYNGEGQPKVGGFLYETRKSPNNYDGFYEIRAFYAMLDLKLRDDLRLTGGVRFEQTDIETAVDTSGVFLAPSLTRPGADGQTIKLVFTEPNSVYKTDYEPFYSINLTYTLNKSMNFRMGYNTTLARPELREMTNVFEFDPFQSALVVGNPKLKNQQTTSYDFRWEWFTNPGEVLSASVFYKEIDNMLAKVYKLNSKGLDARFPEFPAIEFQNDPNKGRVYGIELEIVKDLGKLWRPLKHFFFGSNLLLAQSEIKKTPERLTASRAVDRNSPSNSPLFEQAPYSMNFFLNYNQPKTRTDVTATFNMVGERLIRINLSGEPDLYTRPVPVLDLVFSQFMTRRLQLKGYAKNILDPAIREVYANPNTGGKFYGNEYVRRSYKRGSEIMLGLTYHIL